MKIFPIVIFLVVAYFFFSVGVPWANMGTDQEMGFLKHQNQKCGEHVRRLLR
jgi:hypothetical protein